MHRHTIKVHYYSVMHVVPMQLVGENGDCFLAQFERMLEAPLQIKT